LHPMQVRYQAAPHSEASEYTLVFTPAIQNAEDILNTKPLHWCA
jgi:hypothetical protein